MVVVVVVVLFCVLLPFLVYVKIVKCLLTVYSASRARMFSPSLCERWLCSFLSCSPPLCHLSLLSLLRVSLNHRHFLPAVFVSPARSIIIPSPSACPSIAPIVSVKLTHTKKYTHVESLLLCLWFSALHRQSPSLPSPLTCDKQEHGHTHTQLNTRMRF